MKLKFELVNGCGVLVENRLIVDGEKYIDSINKAIHTWDMGSGIHEGKSTWCNVIIFAEKELGLDVPVFEWRDFEVEKFAEKECEKEFKIKHPSDETKWKKALWKDGFTHNHKSNPAKYTEDDLRKVIAMSKIASTHDGLIDMDSWISNGYEGAIPAYSEEEIIQSLQKYPKYVVMVETISLYKGNGTYGSIVPRIFTNSDGEQQGVIKELIWD